MVGTSGAIASRSSCVVASALSLPLATCGQTVAAEANITATRPVSTSFTPWALPGYGMGMSLMPAMWLSSAPERFDSVPAPECAYGICSGLLCASAISSCTELTPSEGCTTRSWGEEATSETGARSRAKSNGN